MNGQIDTDLWDDQIEEPEEKKPYGRLMMPSILKRIDDVWHFLSPAERAVVEVLREANGKRTQQDIARSKPYLGTHPRFEDYPTSETSLRNVRQIIHDLKVKHRIVIISDTKGYWIPATINECEDYLDTTERQAKASAKSYMVTFHTMSNAINGLRQRPNLFTFNEEGEV